jgi:hypothetical protein
MSNPDFNASNPYPGFPFPGLTKNPFENASGGFSGWARYIGYLQNEAVRFAQERFRRDIGALERFARCRKPEEFIAAQAKFIEEMYSDYAKESVKIAGMFGDAAQQARENFAELGVKSSKNTGR